MSRISRWAEQEGDEEPPDAAVAIKKRVNGLELGVGQADLDELREITLGMKICFQVSECGGHFMGRRGDEGGFVEGAAAGADPVLRGAQFSGGEAHSTHALEETFVDFLDQAHGERQFAQAIKAIVHGGDIVDDFIHVFGSVRGEDVRLCREQVMQRTLGAFDLAGENRLFPHVHEDEEVRIGQSLDGAIKTSQSAVGLRKQGLLTFYPNRRIRRKRRRKKGTIARQLGLVAARAMAWIGG